VSGGDDRPLRRRFAPGTTVEDLKAYMEPYAASLGYVFNPDAEFVDAVLSSEIEILEQTGDVYCPCRMRTGNPKEDARIVCPCIVFHAVRFAGMGKCWCGLFVRSDVEDPEAPVCRTSDIPPGCMKLVKVGTTDIALARVGDELFALSNVCLHAFGPLSGGMLEGYEVMCPWHGWRYDVRTGHTDHPDADVRTYPAVARNGLVYLVLEA
jgi:nitrite reductase/ring-hydroxylating ferredoxin subunit